MHRDSRLGINGTNKAGKDVAWASWRPSHFCNGRLMPSLHQMTPLQIIRSDGFRRWDGLKISASQIPMAKRRRTTTPPALCKMTLLIIDSRYAAPQRNWQDRRVLGPLKPDTLFRRQHGGLIQMDFYPTPWLTSRRHRPVERSIVHSSMNDPPCG